MPLYFEDIEVGLTRDCGSLTVTEEEILEFGERYDPQPFHTDPEAAAEAAYGGLIASGWQICALTARLLVTNYLNDTASAGGRGIDDLRWRRPVGPGDTLSVETEVVTKRPARDMAVGETDVEVTTTNGDGETVLSMTALGLVERRDSE
jgi:acyl dehydratase